MNNIEKKAENEQVQYSGNVVLKLMKDNKIVKKIQTKNTATNRLLYGIMLHLAKQDTYNINKYQPNFMRVGSDSTPNSDFSTSEMASLTALLNPIGNFVDITSRSPLVDLENNKVTSVLKGLFTYSMVGSASINEIGLYSTDDSASLLARVTVNSIQLSPGMSLIVEWTSVIENKVG